MHSLRRSAFQLQTNLPPRKHSLPGPDAPCFLDGVTDVKRRPRSASLPQTKDDLRQGTDDLQDLLSDIAIIDDASSIHPGQRRDTFEAAELAMAPSSAFTTTSNARASSVLSYSQAGALCKIGLSNGPQHSHADGKRRQDCLTSQTSHDTLSATASQPVRIAHETLPNTPQTGCHSSVQYSQDVVNTLMTGSSGKSFDLNVVPFNLARHRSSPKEKQPPSDVRTSMSTISNSQQTPSVAKSSFLAPPTTAENSHLHQLPERRSERADNGEKADKTGSAPIIHIRRPSTSLSWLTATLRPFPWQPVKVSRASGHCNASHLASAYSVLAAGL